MSRAGRSTPGRRSIALREVCSPRRLPVIGGNVIPAERELCSPRWARGIERNDVPGWVERAKGRVRRSAPTACDVPRPPHVTFRPLSERIVYTRQLLGPECDVPPARRPLSAPTAAHGPLSPPTAGRTDRWAHRPLGAPTAGRTDRWAHGPLGARTAGRTDRWAHRPLGARTARAHWRRMAIFPAWFCVCRWSRSPRPC